MACSARLLKSTADFLRLIKTRFRVDHQIIGSDLASGTTLGIEHQAPEELQSEQVNILVPYGSLFFAAAPVFEEGLPKADNPHYGAVILVLKGRKGLSCTFLVVLERYIKNLKTNDSKLMLAGVSKEIRRQLVDTGLLQEIDRENVYMGQSCMANQFWRRTKLERSGSMK